MEAAMVPTLSSSTAGYASSPLYRTTLTEVRPACTGEDPSDLIADTRGSGLRPSDLTATGGALTGRNPP